MFKTLTTSIAAVAFALPLIAGAAQAQQAPNAVFGDRPLDLNVESAVENTGTLRYSVFFDGFARSLDVAAEEVVALIAEDAVMMEASRLVIIADPDGTAEAAEDTSFVYAEAVRIALERHELPAGMTVAIRENLRGVLQGEADQGPVLRDGHRVEIAVYPNGGALPEVSALR